MNRRLEKPLRELRPLSDDQVVSLELRTAVTCLRAAREQLELAAVSMAVASSVDKDEESFADADALVEAASEIGRTLERQILRRLAAFPPSPLRASPHPSSPEAANTPGLARAQPRFTHASTLAGDTYDGEPAAFAMASGDVATRAARGARTVH